MKFIFIKRSYFCVLHPLLGAQIKFVIFLENQTTLMLMVCLYVTGLYEEKGCGVFQIKTKFKVLF